MSIQFSWDELQSVCQGRWLIEPKSGEGITAISTDSRAIESGQLFLALSGDRFDGHDFIDTAVENGAAAIIVSKEVDAPIPALLVNDTLSAYQTLSLYHRKRFPNTLMIGITGSSGKTSSKEIIAAVVESVYGKDAVLLTRGNTNNHIGVPQNLLRLGPQHKCAVLEMGTNSPGEIELLRTLVLPEIAVLTNIGPVHLEGLGSVEGVAREKSDIFAGAKLAVLPWQYAELPEVKHKLPSNTITTGFDSAADIVISNSRNGLKSSSFDLAYDHSTTTVEWSLTGRHMALNAAAAFAVGHHLDLKNDEIAAALKHCRNEKMRMQVIELAGKTFINDAYNANPDSMKALINWLHDSVKEQSRLILVLGDMLELGENESALHQSVIDHAQSQLPDGRIICFGPRMSAVGQTHQGFEDMDSLKIALAEQTAEGDIIAFKGSRGMGLERILPEH